MRLFAETESLHGRRVSDEPALVNDYIIPAAITAPTTAAVLGIWGELEAPFYAKAAFTAVALWPGSVGAFCNTVNASKTVAIRHAKSYGGGAIAGVYLLAAIGNADAATIEPPSQFREQDAQVLILDAE